MGILAFDLGGTKLATAFFDSAGEIISREISPIEKRKGSEVGDLICKNVGSLIEVIAMRGDTVEAIGISVPGIYHAKTGTVWAPNIPGWEDYPLLNEVSEIVKNIPVTIDSDRACYILGEVWKGNAQQCRDAIFLAVGTGIGAGILTDGKVLRGNNDIAGAIGWMALHPPFDAEYAGCGFFEEFASGEGIPKCFRKLLAKRKSYAGSLKDRREEEITSWDVFAAYQSGDELAREVITMCIQYWGMACANLVSLFNPQKIIFGGGVFGPAVPLIGAIKEEATRWAQPISIQQAAFEASALGSDAGVMGAGFLALKSLQQ